MLGEIGEDSGAVKVYWDSCAGGVGLVGVGEAWWVFSDADYKLPLKLDVSSFGGYCAGLRVHILEVAEGEGSRETEQFIFMLYLMSMRIGVC